MRIFIFLLNNNIAMKTKIILKKEDPRMINLIYDFIKENKGAIIEYSDSTIVFENNTELTQKIKSYPIFASSIDEIK